MATTSELETKLNDIFVKKAPKLPENGKKGLVKYLPYISLIIGLLTLWTAWGLWHWAHAISKLVDWANQLSAAYGGNTIAASRMSFVLWVSLAVLLVEAVLYFLAYPGLKTQKKQGWNYLYFGAIVNLVYGIVMIFTDYGGFGSFIGSLIGSAIGFYLLFQIREYYLGKRVAPVASAAPKS